MSEQKLCSECDQPMLNVKGQGFTMLGEPLGHVCVGCELLSNKLHVWEIEQKITICTNCEWIGMDMACGVRKYTCENVNKRDVCIIDPVTGLVFCETKNKGNCPDYSSVDDE